MEIYLVCNEFQNKITENLNGKTGTSANKFRELESMIGDLKNHISDCPNLNLSKIFIFMQVWLTRIAFLN